MQVNNNVFNQIDVSALLSVNSTALNTIDDITVPQLNEIDSASCKDDLKDKHPRIALPTANPTKAEAQLSLEALISALQEKNRASSLDSAKKALDGSAQNRALQNEKRMKELDTQVSKLEEQQKMSKIQKIMSYVSAALQLVGSVIAIGFAIACPNPATIGCAVMATAAAIENAMNVFTDGKVSLSAGLQKLDEALGCDGVLAKTLEIYIAVRMMSCQIALAVINPADAVSAAAKLIGGIANITSSAANLAISGANMGMNIQKANLNSEVQDSQSRQMLIQALLAQIDSSCEKEMEQIKEELEQGLNMASGVEQVLDNLNNALKASTSAAV